jgi:glycogen debranching enzyme
LDSAIINFSSALSSKGLPTIIESEKDLDLIISAFEQVVRDLNLWQFYVLDVSKERSSIKAALQSKDVTIWDGPEIVGRSVPELANIFRDHGKVSGIGALSSRLGVTVNGSVAAGFIQVAYPNIGNIDALVDSWIQVIDIINVPLYQQWEADIRAAIDNVRNRVRYIRLDKNGPKLGEISEQ